MKIRISSRQSDLAKNQAYQVGDALKNHGFQVEYFFRESLGDKNLTDPLWKMPEKGVFTEDFYSDLKEDKTDIVVHSWKDLPTEEKEHTFIAATLPRADQRDLLLLKSTSDLKKNIKIYSSSPRRAYNLNEFLKSALPAQPEIVTFENVRGNIQTRVKKLLENPDIDGLVLAKAALDRLLSDERCVETRDFLKNTLKQLKWMVLPLRVNPNAAAQGAIAVEVLRQRADLIDVLQKINCRSSYESANREREILKEFGGGCHLALGMSVLHRPWGTIELVKGKSPSGEAIHIEKFKAVKILDNSVQKVRLKFEVSRRQIKNNDLSLYNALYVAKIEAWNSDIKFDGIIWTSGIETWKKLARLGVWVNGSNESLGESEEARIENLSERPLNWARLSHSTASASGHKAAVAGYEVQLKVIDENIPENAAFIWMSPQEFDTAVAQFPEIRNAMHICGPGRTFEAMKSRLGGEEKLFIEIFLY